LNAIANDNKGILKDKKISNLLLTTNDVP